MLIRQALATERTQLVSFGGAVAAAAVPRLRQVALARHDAHVGGVEELKVLHVARLAGGGERARRHLAPDALAPVKYTHKWACTGVGHDSYTICYTFQH